VGRRRTREVLRLLRSRYRPFTTRLDLSLDRLAIPTSGFNTSSNRILHTCDFLPDWLTLSGIPFEDSPHVDFVRRYLNEPGFDYKRTAYYGLAVRGHLPFPAYGAEGAEARCRQFIALTHRIQSEGYQPEVYGAITLAECDDGSTMVINGKHRLAVLMALEVREIPVVLCFANEIKALFRDVQERSRPARFYSKSHSMIERLGRPLSGDQSRIRSLVEKIKSYNLETWADIYHPIPFYEFRNLTTQVTFFTPYQRLAMILRGYQNLRGLRVLDLGCNVGFYSFSLAKRGAQVVGVDIRPEYIEIASCVARVYEVPVTFLNMPITPEFIEEDGKGFDITLCFSMLQWVVEQKGIEYAREILRAISKRSRSLFFDVAVNSGKACLTCEPGRELALVESLLRDSTSFRHIAHVGDVQPYGTYRRHVFFCTHGDAY